MLTLGPGSWRSNCSRWGPDTTVCRVQAAAMQRVTKGVDYSLHPGAAGGARTGAQKQHANSADTAGKPRKRTPRPEADTTQSAHTESRHPPPHNQHQPQALVSAVTAGDPLSPVRCATRAPPHCTAMKWFPHTCMHRTHHQTAGEDHGAAPKHFLLERNRCHLHRMQELTAACTLSKAFLHALQLARSQPQVKPAQLSCPTHLTTTCRLCLLLTAHIA